MLKRDDLKFGILLGFLAPIAGMITYYFVSFYTRDVRFSEFLLFLKTNKALLTGVSSISLVAECGDLYHLHQHSQGQDGKRHFYLHAYLRNYRPPDQTGGVSCR